MSIYDSETKEQYIKRITFGKPLSKYEEEQKYLNWLLSERRD